MNKKLIAIIGIVLVGIIMVGTYVIKNNVRDEVKEKNNESVNEGTTTSQSKTLIVYYSAQSHTEAVANKLASKMNASLFEIVPVDKYTSEDLNYSNSNSRVSKEHDDESLRDIKLVSTSVDNWESYDTVLIGYPIWWGIAAWPVNNFVKSNDFSGKRVIPFCTSASSGLGRSGELLKAMANGGDWMEGKRFTSSPSERDIDSFVESLR